MKRDWMTMTGWAMLILLALFLIGASAVPKLFNMDVAQQSLESLGWPWRYLFMIGVIELVLTILVLVPRTTLIGGILMMGLLGGALATNLRVENPVFSHTLFSIYLGIFMWIGIWLRSPAIRAVFPLTPRQPARSAS